MITEADVASVLQRRGPQHARAIAGFLRAKHGAVARKDVNSILYAGKGRMFARSEDERPIWSLIDEQGQVEDVDRDDSHDAPAQVNPVLSVREREPQGAPRTRMPAAIRQPNQNA